MPLSPDDLYRLERRNETLVTAAVDEIRQLRAALAEALDEWDKWINDERGSFRGVPDPWVPHPRSVELRKLVGP